MEPANIQTPVPNLDQNQAVSPQSSTASIPEQMATTNAMPDEKLIAYMTGIEKDSLLENALDSEHSNAHRKFHTPVYIVLTSHRLIIGKETGEIAVEFKLSEIKLLKYKKGFFGGLLGGSITFEIPNNNMVKLGDRKKLSFSTIKDNAKIGQNTPQFVSYLQTRGTESVSL